jgi:glucose/arabinose dehydrogenase
MKRHVILWIVIIIASLILGFITTLGINAQANDLNLKITSYSTPMAHVSSGGERGAAIARLSNDQYLLGGGKEGFGLYLYDAKDNSERFLGRVAKASERLDDSRFAITDIGILSQKGEVANVVVSYPRYDSNRQCVSLVLSSFKIDLAQQAKVTRNGIWFTSKPCVPVSAVQHAAGRIEVIDKSSVYLTLGDLGFRKINSVKARGDLGSLFKINKSKIEKISVGHRNQQGIALIGSDLYASEHGPRGGDELNLIIKGSDYGWPAVTYGEPYSAGDYVKPRETGSHKGFVKPLKYWVPSVAPTELVVLPAGSAWGKWASQLVMGTLREEALIFIELKDRSTVGQVLKVDVNERIRDLEISEDGQIVATTDSGKILFIQNN